MKSTIRVTTALILTLLLSPIAQAQEQSLQSPLDTQAAETSLLEEDVSESQAPTKILPGAKLLIKYSSFRPVIAAALLKKKVPVTIVTRPSQADFFMESVTEAKKEKTGERITKLLLFGWGAGSGKSFDAAISIMNAHGEIVFAENIEKGNARKAARRIATKLKKQIEKNSAMQSTTDK